jgi:hypothetical protein
LFQKSIDYRGTAMTEVSIPFENAVELCRYFREEHKVRMFSQCWGCVRFSKGNPEKMCFYKPPSNNGCRFVNELYERELTILRKTNLDKQ